MNEWLLLVAATAGMNQTTTGAEEVATHATEEIAVYIVEVVLSNPWVIAVLVTALAVAVWIIARDATRLGDVGSAILWLTGMLIAPWIETLKDQRIAKALVAALVLVLVDFYVRGKTRFGHTFLAVAVIMQALTPAILEVARGWVCCEGQGG